MKQEDLKDKLLHKNNVKALDDEEVEKASGGFNRDPGRCPLCGEPKDSNGICANRRCRNYGSYC